MVNPTDPSIGWGSEFWLSTDETSANLKQTDQCISMGLPNDQADKVDVTHFKSPQRRKQYIAGLLDAGDIQIGHNYEPGSDTDALIRGARDTGGRRAFKMVLLDGAGATWAINGLCRVRGYERNVPLADKKTSVTTIILDGAVNEAAGA